MRDCYTQADLAKAIKEGETEVIIRSYETFYVNNTSPRMVAYDNASPRMVAHGNASPTMVAYDNASPRMEAHDNTSPRMVAHDNASPRMVAYDNASPRMEAHGSASPRMEAHGSASPRMEAHGSASPRMVAYDNASPRMEAHGSASPAIRILALATAIAFGAMHIEAGDQATIVVHSDNVTVSGGNVMIPKHANDSKGWCRNHGIEVHDGIATLYKAVDENYQSARGGDYTPGTTPTAPDWDGGDQECGYGLHFSPTPSSAMRFMPNAVRFVACPVALADIPKVHPNGRYPEKVKARGCFAPVYEVDINGDPV